MVWTISVVIWITFETSKLKLVTNHMCVFVCSCVNECANALFVCNAIFILLFEILMWQGCPYSTMYERIKDSLFIIWRCCAGKLYKLRYFCKFQNRGKERKARSISCSMVKLRNKYKLFMKKSIMLKSSFTI